MTAFLIVTFLFAPPGVPPSTRLMMTHLPIETLRPEPDAEAADHGDICVSIFYFSWCAAFGLLPTYILTGNLKTVFFCYSRCGYR